MSSRFLSTWMTINQCFLLFLRYIAFDASCRAGLSSKGTSATQFDSLPRPKISASILILKYILSELTILLLLRNLFFFLSIDFSCSHVWISWTTRHLAQDCNHYKHHYLRQSCPFVNRVWSLVATSWIVLCSFPRSSLFKLFGVACHSLLLEPVIFQ